jgi:PhnB protein
MARKATKPVPEGMHSLTTELWFNGNCREAIDYYKRIFKAEVQGEVDYAPDGKVLHALLRFGDSNIMVADALGNDYEKGPENWTTASMYLYVPDADATFKEATAAGCRVIMPILDAFWGDRTGEVRDPFGHCWSIATNKLVLTRDEMRKRQEEWFEHHQQSPGQEKEPK